MGLLSWITSYRFSKRTVLLWDQSEHSVEGKNFQSPSGLARCLFSSFLGSGEWRNEFDMTVDEPEHQRWRGAGTKPCWCLVYSSSHCVFLLFNSSMLCTRSDNDWELKKKKSTLTFSQPWLELTTKANAAASLWRVGFSLCRFGLRTSFGTEWASGTLSAWWAGGFLFYNWYE